MTAFLIHIYIYFSAHRRLLAGSLVLLTAVCLVAVAHLTYKEDISAFLPEGESHARINRLYQHISHSNRIILHFSSGDTARHDAAPLIEAIERFADILQEIDTLHRIPAVVRQIDESRMPEVAGFVRQHIPYFLTGADYARIDSLLATNQSVGALLEENKRLLMLPSGGMMQQQIMSDPLHLFTPVMEKLRDFQAGNPDDAEVHEGYLLVRTNGRLKARIWITSPYGVSETAQNEALLQLIDRASAETVRLLPGIDIRCFGAPAIAVTNARQIKQDSLVAV